VTIRPDGTDLTGRPVGGISGSGSSYQSGRQGREAAPKAAPAARGGPDSSSAASSRTSRTSSSRLASASAADTDEVRASGGNYLVQLSSQRSESEARASFRVLQAKFPNQLRNRSPVVRRADLGNKGVYYRALVGPFGSSDEAGRFCTNLRSAGGQCIIQRN
jgi:hypothetical protein